MNISLNFSNLKQPADICKRGEHYSVECLQHNFCPQMQDWILNAGIAVSVIYLLHGWALFLYFKYINDRLPWNKIYESHPYLLRPYILAVGPIKLAMPFLGDMREESRKKYYATMVSNSASKLLLGYIVTTLYLALAK